MPRRIPWLTFGLVTLILLGVCWRLHPRAPIATAAPAMAGEPRLVLWAWETPEDLRALDPTRAGVAFLSRELLLGSTLEVRPRHQPLLLPQNTFLIAVVRIETTPSFPWRNADLDQIATQVVAAAIQPGVRALQVDFDARASERAPYAALLQHVRARLPAGTPLSITALTSWCTSQSWFRDLPISEAVPMFFRMGGVPGSRPFLPRSLASVREPLCTGSAGLATDEVWPALDKRQRVYLFRPGPWRPEDLALINAGRYQRLQTLNTMSLLRPQP